MTTPERVIEVARDHLLDQGILDFSLRALARDLGMTAPALYRHFPRKSSLLEAVAARSYDLLDEHVMGGLRGEGAHDRLAGVAHGYLRFGLDHPRDFAVLALLPGAFGAASLPEALLDREAATLRFWTDRVRDAVHAGVLRDESPEAVAGLLRSMAHGLISMYLRGALDAEDDRAFEQLFWASALRVMEGLAGASWNRDGLPKVVEGALRRSCGAGDEVR